MEITQIKDIEDLFRYEAIKMTDIADTLKKCENCGKFFMTDGKLSEIKYCNRKAPGKALICSVIGANNKKIFQNQDNLFAI